MIKKICLTATTYLFAFSAFAFTSCPKAEVTNSPVFCESFKTAARCYCTSSGLPAGLCQNVDEIYLRMIIIYTNLENACRSQKYTTQQDCLDNWRCYLYGGMDSQSRICNSNGSRCTTMNV